MAAFSMMDPPFDAPGDLVENKEKITDFPSR